MNKRLSIQEETENAPASITIGKDEEFEEALAEAVGEGLEYISEAVAPILRIYLSDAMSIDVTVLKSRLNDNDAKALQQGLEKMLGFGARIFEKKMLVNLQSKLGLRYQVERNFVFSEEVKKARRLFENSRSVQYGKSIANDSDDEQGNTNSTTEK